MPNYDIYFSGLTVRIKCDYFLRIITNTPMPTPAITTGIIHIEMLCAPAKSNAVLSCFNTAITRLLRAGLVYLIY